MEQATVNRFVPLKQACDQFHWGKSFCRKFCRAIGAEIRITPKMYRYDTEIIRQELQKLRTEQNA